MRRRRERDDLPEVFRGSDAIAAGVLTQRELRGPWLRRLFHGVYAPRQVPLTHELRCRAAALVAPPNAVLTGRSAAVLYGVGLAGRTEPVQVLVPQRQRFHRAAGLEVHRREVNAGERRPWQDIWLATPQRVGLDLVLGRPLRRGVADLDAAVRAGLVDLDQLRATVARRHDKGIELARQAADLADPRAESPPESEVRVLLVLNGLRPVPQYEITDQRGFVARVDLALPEHRVAVEYDGAWHAEPGQLARDRQRLNRIQAAGWRVVSITAAQLRGDPAAVIGAVRAALHPQFASVSSL